MKKEGKIFRKRGKIFRKRGMETETLGWWIIAIAILVIVIVGFIILKGKGISAIEYIKNLFRFGG